MNTQEQQTEKRSFTSVFAVGFVVLLGFIGLMDDLGIGWLNYYAADIFQQIIDYIVLIFVIGILLVIFTAPKWIKRLLYWGAD